MIWMPRCVTRDPNLSCGRSRSVGSVPPSYEYHSQIFHLSPWHSGPQGQPQNPIFTDEHYEIHFDLITQRKLGFSCLTNTQES